MLGFYTPQHGELNVGIYKMSELDNDLWLRHCGVVMQSGYIFSGTILENIGLSDSMPDLLKAKEAARIASVNTFIEGLPMGYYTKIGVNGIELSGGQKQRLYIARAIYKQPDFLFLDEATSSLDANNELKIINNLRDYYAERTVVISAHRLSTIKNADKIIYLENGQIKEEGTHDELLGLKGKYYTLVKNQLELEG
jgi:ATP-binding cassette subfamily B protein